MTLNRNLPSQLFPLVAVLAAMLLALRWLPVAPIIAYAAIFISSSLLYWVICRQWLKVEASSLETPAVGDAERGRGALPEGLVLILLILFLTRLSFLGANPLGSDDVYRYVWDGRVQTAGINPYRYAPNDEALAHLHTTRLPALVNHPEMKTIYFPLSQWIFYLGYHLSGERVWGFQLFLLVAEALTIVGLLLLMRELRYSGWRALIYAASPLAILQFSLDAHVDALGFPFLVFGLLFYLRKRTTASLLLLGCSLLIKPVAFAILPILFLNERGLINKAKVVLLPLAVLVISFAPYVSDANPFESLTHFSKHWLFNGALFSVLFPLFSDNQVTRLWCLAILAIALVLLYMSKKQLLEKIVLAVLLLLLCSPVVHVWYVGWLVVLLPLAPLSSGLALAAAASLASVTYAIYRLQGVWKEYPLVLALEYVPVLVLLWFDLYGRRGVSRSTAQPNNLTDETSRRSDNES